MFRITRRTLALAGAGLALPATARAAAPDEPTIGSPQARVHLVEYASTTCGHCAAFHHANWATLKANYIDTGRIRFSLREMATPPPQLALALFQLARCETDSSAEYFRRLAVVFERQRAIFETGSMAAAGDMMATIGAEWGLTRAQVIAAIQDEAGVERMNRSITEAGQRGIDGTPAFLINGERVSDSDFVTPAGMARVLDASLA